jgi:hypothetical protein
MKRCPYCQNGDITWASIAGPGRLHSWTVIRHPFDPDFAAHLPYIVGLVEFDDAPGVRLITHMLPPEPERLCTDMPVLPVFGTDPRTPSPFHFTPRPA